MRNTITQIIRFLIVGVCVVVVNLFLLHTLTEFFHLWYLLSSVISYLLAVMLNFILQKFWVFSHLSLDTLRKQAVSYGIVSVIYLGCNTLFMYISVDYLHIRYLWAQAGITLVLSVVNFFVNRMVIFKHPDQAINY